MTRIALINLKNTSQGSFWIAAAMVACVLSACEGEASAVCDEDPCFSRGCPGFPGDLACGVNAPEAVGDRKARRGCVGGCPADAPVCDRRLDRCVACFRHSECGNDTFCDVFSGRCRTRCDTDLDCEGSDSRWCAEGYCRPDAEVQVWGDASFEAGYLRHQPIESRAEFGSSLALSADGRVLATHGALGSGAVEVWRQGEGGWERETRLLAGLYPDPQLYRAFALALSPDGNLLVVGDPLESSLDKGVFATLRGGSDSPLSDQETAGAAYVFEKLSGVWRLVAVLKPSNTHRQQNFGAAVALADHGRLIAVGSPRERAASRGVGGAQTDLTAEGAGAVYLFARSAETWAQTSYLKASDSAPTLRFGASLALSHAGAVLAVGAANGTHQKGTAYLFEAHNGIWEERQKLLHEHDEDVLGASFGKSLALSGNGNVLAVGTYRDAPEANETGDYPGSVHVYARAGTRWGLQTRLKSTRPHSHNEFGSAVALSADGRTLAVGESVDRSAGTGLNPPPISEELRASGAAYIYQRLHREWVERAYIKHRFKQEYAMFGSRVALSASGSTLAVSSHLDFGSSVADVSEREADPAFRSGSVTVFKRARE